MTTTERSLVIITQAGDNSVGVYNTTASGSTGGKDGMYSTVHSEDPSKAIDNLPSTKYFNYGLTGSIITMADAPGVGTGFYITPAISNASIAVSLRFATGNDFSNRDPLTVTLEGTNHNTLDDGSSWVLIYNGLTGINSTGDPGRQQYVPQQTFSNTIAYKSYRLLVTSQRGPEHGVQYSEFQIIGYI
jgi:hypothetical protein